MKLTFTYFRRILCGIFFSILFLKASAQPILTYTQYVAGLDYPLETVNAGDGSNRMFIVQQNGIVRLYKSGVLSTFIDISPIITFSGEQGLLSMVFHPDYDGVTNRYFFLYYTIRVGNVTTIKVTRFQSTLGDPDTGDPLTASEVISIDKPSGSSYTNHNGGKLNFGNDGMLYFATGDGGSGNDPFNNAQNGMSLLGKMIRININGSTGSTPLYSIPPDNPFLLANDPFDQVLDEVWALGLRNPYRWSFDAPTGYMYIGDVGQGVREEVDIVTPMVSSTGVNYGWRCIEGTTPTPGVPACVPAPGVYVPPVFEYDHNATGGFAITGGFVYHGTASPLLANHYVFADYVSGNVWVRSSAGLVTRQSTQLAGIAGFGLDENGELYASLRGSAAGEGRIMLVSSSAVLPVSLLSFTGTALNSYNELKWKTASEQNTDKFIVEYSTDGIHFNFAGQVTASNNPSGSSYTYQHAINTPGRTYYRLQTINTDGSARYSAIIVVGENGDKDIRIYPTVISNSKLELITSTPVEMVRVVDAGGREVYRSNTGGRQGYFSVQLPSLPAGIYLVAIQSRTFTKTEKIIIQ